VGQFFCSKTVLSTVSQKENLYFPVHVYPFDSEAAGSDYCFKSVSVLCTHLYQSDTGLLYHLIFLGKVDQLTAG
jgi:hypothetical protein